MLRNTLKGTIVLVSFPFDDFSSAKQRPALCLSRKTGPFHQVALAYITSRVPSSLLPSDLLIEDTHADFEATGLNCTSVVRLHHLWTVKVEFIVRELGKLQGDLQTTADEKLSRFFALNLDTHLAAD